MMTSWTPTERTIPTEYGNIRYGGQCRDDYRNFETYDQGGGHTIFTLQRPALLAFLEAQRKYAHRSGWSPQRIRRNTVKVGKEDVPEGRHIYVLPGTTRSCLTQTSLYRRDSSRYAAPQITGHTRGLAIDVDQSQGNLEDVNESLRGAGWTQTRPVDEPWHFSYGVTI